MATSILSPSSPLLPNTALFTALFPAFAGLTALISPSAGLSLFDVQTPTNPESRKLALNLMRLFGIRDVFIGASTGAAWYLGERRMLGVLCLLGAAVTVVDGVAQRDQTVKGAWKHWGFTPVMFGLGAGMVGWLDGLI